MKLSKSIVKKIFPQYVRKKHAREEYNRDIEILRRHLIRCKYSQICLHDATEKDIRVITDISRCLDVEISLFKTDSLLNREILHVLCSIEYACKQNNELLDEGIPEKNIYRVHVSNDERFTKLDVYDTLLGYTRKDDFEGFTVYGDINVENKIVILGNSTSDVDCGNCRSWIEEFSNILNRDRKGCCVISGAIMAATSTQEVLRLYRDVLNLGPSLVISYSGITDAYNEHFNDRNFCSLDYQIDSFDTLIKLYKKDGIRLMQLLVRT